MDKIGEDWTGVHLGKFEKRQIYISLYQNVIYTLLENQSQLLSGCDFANERLLLCQFDI